MSVVDRETFPTSYLSPSDEIASKGSNSSLDSASFDEAKAKLFNLRRVSSAFLDLTDACDSNEGENQGCCKKINAKLITYKAFYFLFFGAVGCLFPYLAVFYKQMWLSAHQVGILIGLRPFIQMCAAPLWGILADSYHVSKWILLMSIGAWLASNYSLSLVKPGPHISPCNMDNISYLPMPEYNLIQKLGNQTGLNSSTMTQFLQQYHLSKERIYKLINGSTLSFLGETNIERARDKLLKHSKDILETNRNKTHTNRNRTSTVPQRHGWTSNMTKALYSHIVFRMFARQKNITLSRKNKDGNSARRKPFFGKRSALDYTNPTKDEVEDAWDLNNTFRLLNKDSVMPYQRLLVADELEEEFDSLNMEGGYPWPLDTIADYEDTQESNDWVKWDKAKQMFTILLIITICGTVLSSPAATLADTGTLQTLGESRYLYGQQRLWGAFGWGLGAFIVGAIVSTIQEAKLCSDPKHVDYMLSFYVFAVMMGCAFICAAFFKFQSPEEKQNYESICEGISMFYDCQHACFIMTLLCSGAAMGFIHTFLFWHLHDMGGTQFLFSVIAAIQCTSEVFMYFLSGYLILRVGCDSVFYIGLLSNVLRLLAYALISEPLFAIPIEILQGVSSASIWTAAICYVGLIPGAQYTLQALLHGLYWGLGHGGGGILGGILVTYIGSNATFIVYSFLCLINLAILVTIKYWSKVMELMGNYTYVENIPAGTYILMASHVKSAEGKK